MKLNGLITAKWRNGVMGAALAGVAGLLCLTPLGSSLSGSSYDWLYLFRPDRDRAPPKPGHAAGVLPIQDTVILFMDPDSDARLGQKRRGSWDRALHAQMLDRLREYLPRAVVFDILFVESPDEPEGDEKLVRAAKASGNVVVAAKPTADLYEGEVVGMQSAKPPFPRLREVVKWGVAEAADANRTIRTHYSLPDLNVPSMAWRVAELTMTNPPPPFEPRWMNYYGPPGTIPNFSYHELFESNGIPINALSNKVVFVGGRYDVGYSGGKRSDDVRTPYTRWTDRLSTGVEVSATAYLNIVRGDWLQRLPPWCESGLIVLCGLVAGFGLAVFRPLPAAGLAVLGFVLAGGLTVLLTWSSRVWFPWLIVGAVQIPIALGWSVLSQAARLHREKRALEQALALASGGKATPHPASVPAPQPTGGAQPEPGTPSPFFTPTPGMGAGPWASDRPPFPAVPDHQILRVIGKGAYGEVYLARNLIGTFHAVKVVYPQSTHDPASLEREFNGIKNFAPISRSHPGFVNILHVGRSETGGYIYCVMELADDEATGQQINPETYSAKNLARVLKKRGRLPLAECLQLCLQLGDALEHLHRHNLIHRDIKPSNIIFVGGAPKFADVGLVTGVVADGRESTVIGTPFRMAPEGPGKPTADIYSLGKVLYEAGFGLDVNRFPELPTDLMKTGGESALFEFNRIVMKACDDENRRYRSAAALCVDMAALLRRVKEGTT